MIDNAPSHAQRGTQESQVNTVFDAIQTHLAWRKDLQSAIASGILQVPVIEQTERGDPCGVLRWLEGPAKTLFHEDHFLVDLQDKLAYLQVCATYAVDLARTGQRDEAVAELASGVFSRVSREIVQDLAQMAKRHNLH